MARFAPVAPATPADELRQLLNESESLAVNIRGAGAERGLALLAALDRIQALFPELETTGVNLLAEQGRWVGVQGAVRRHARPLLRELRALGGLPALRGQRAIATANWWWWLDDSLRRQQRRQLRTTLLGVIAVIGLLAGGRWLLGVLFPVDPAVAASYRLRIDAEQAAAAGDYVTALARIEEADRALPDNPGVLMWLAALYDLNDRPADAAALAARLVQTHPAAAVYTGIGQVYIQIDLPERGLAYAQQAIAADADSAQGHLIAGISLEMLGRYDDAIRSFNQAADLAAATGNAEIEAVARVHVGQIMQARGFLQPEAAANPTPASATAP